MKRLKYSILTAALLLTIAAAAQAQNKTEQEQLTREMTLEREYDPTVQDANKVNRLPEVKEPVVTKRPIDYSPFTTPAEPDKEITTLPSGNIHTNIAHTKKRGYLHFGGGMYMNFDGDAGYHLIDNERGILGIYFTHHSTNGDVKLTEQYDDFVSSLDVENYSFFVSPQYETTRKAKLNDNLGVLKFDYAVGENTRLKLGASYGYTSFNYYGYHFYQQPFYSEDTTANQVNKVFHIDAGISGIANDKFLYLIDAEYHNFNQKYGWTTLNAGIRENHITGNFDFGYIFGATDNSRVGLAGLVNYCYQTPPQNNPVPDFAEFDYEPHSHLSATFTPYYRMSGDSWNFQLGANIILLNADTSTVFVTPNVNLEANLSEKTVFYANATGETRLNDAHELSQQNRYIDLCNDFRPSRTWIDGTLGIRSAIATGAQIDVFAGYKSTKDAIFFIPVSYGYRSDMAYAEIGYRRDFMAYHTAIQQDAALLHAGAAVRYSYRSIVDFSLKGVYNQWNITDDIKPYGMPQIELNAALTVKPLAPLALDLGYYLGTNRYTQLFGADMKMPALNDLNFRASWAFNDMFGAYIRLNNLLFKQQEYISGYPTQGFNAMAGININF